MHACMKIHHRRIVLAGMSDPTEEGGVILHLAVEIKDNHATYQR